MEAIAGRVREVIGRSGLRQGEFAASIGLDPTKLSKSLSGVRRFTSLELALIADRGGITIDWLLTGAGAAPAAVAARAAALPPESVAAAVDRAEHLADLWAGLVDLGALDAPLPLPTVRLRGRMVDQGAALATAAWEAVDARGMAERVVDDLPGVVEAAFDVHVAVEHLGGGLDGLSYRRGGFRLALVAADVAATRQRFTIAHELGHLMAADADGILVDEDVMAPQAPRRLVEMRANAFAAAFLMPVGLLRERAGAGLELHDFARLVGELRVSPSALAWRLRSLDLVDDDERGRLGGTDPRAAALLGGWSDDFRALEAERGASRPCMRLVRAAVLAYERGETSIRPLAAILDRPPDEVLAALQSHSDPAPPTEDEEPVFTP